MNAICQALGKEMVNIYFLRNPIKQCLRISKAAHYYDMTIKEYR